MSEKKRMPAERKPPRKISKTYLENAALYYLQRYATSAENFRRVMMRKVKRSCAFHDMPVEDCIPLVEDLITRYTAVGLLDDTSFSLARVTSLRRQGLSRQGILMKLQAKGLSPAQIESALQQVDAEEEDPETAAALAYAKRKKLGRWRKIPRDPQKDLAAMARAGFSYEVARRVLEAPEED